MRGWSVLAMMALITWVPVSRADVELLVANKPVAAAAAATSYTDVMLKIPAGTQMQLRAKAMKRENGMEILRGEVEIKVNTLLVRAPQASVERNDKLIVVKMETAEVSTASP